MRRAAAPLVALTLVLFACGSEEPTDPGEATADTAEEIAEDTADDTEDPGEGTGEAAEGLDEDVEQLADDLAEDLESQQEAVGGGGAELTVDGETWTFDSVLCAFGPEEIGDEDAEFVLSAISDGLQLYVSIDGFGHSVTLDDIDNFEDPSVGWAAGGPMAAITGEVEEFIQVDGKQVRAEAEFSDSRDELSSTSAPGLLEATCP